MTALAYAAAAIFSLLGATHLLYTLHDCIRRPRYFRPTDGSPLDAMRLTRTAIAPAETIGQAYSAFI